MAAAWKDAGGHALTLQLLGRFIADAYPDKDIRHFREVKFEEADREHQGRSAFKVMIAYERWLQSAAPERQRELAILRLTGLFDRPISRELLNVLRTEPAIPGLTDTLVKLKDTEWNIALTRLSDVDLLTVTPTAVDAHPLIREYFAKHLRARQSAAFQAAHSRLYDHLCANTEHRPDTLVSLQPLYEAVVHGCLAGRQQEAYHVYVDRILRGTESGGFYSTRKLGAIGSDLAGVSAFFDEPWSRVSTNFGEHQQAWLLNQAALRLRAVGRLTEALQPMRVSGELYVKVQFWKGAAITYSNLSHLELTRGLLPDAVADAGESIIYADRSGDIFVRLGGRAMAADALHQSGERDEAGRLFAEAERMQKEHQSEFDLLYSLQGFLYCDWLLAPAERTAWQFLVCDIDSRPTTRPLGNDEFTAVCTEVERRGRKMFDWRAPSDPLLDIALDHLTLARVELTRVILSCPLPQPTLDLSHVAAALNGLRNAGTTHHIPKGLLTAALYHFVRGGAASARSALDEAQQIAERGPMPLYLADIHLLRARLFRDKSELAKARALIETHGYWRRKEELEDAEAAAKDWST